MHVNGLSIRPFASTAAAARTLARDVARELALKPTLVLGLPTGRTPVPFYAELVALYARGRADFAGATTFNLGFDPAPGELKKKGHLFSVVITPTGWTLTEHVDKADPQSKNVTHAKAATKFAQGEWFTLLLEVKGDDVVVRVDGKEPLRAKAKDFHVKKPGLVFRVGGKDGQDMLVDNVKVWALE